jgi:isopentenyl phosphate kinase
MNELVFVKLGGSVITVKTEAETARMEVVDRLAGEVARALEARPGLRLVLGHGSGSYGHVAGRKHGTRDGVHNAIEWRGFAKVATAAARLNRIVADRFSGAGVPIWSLQPSASALCRGGKLVSLATAPIEAAVDLGLVPLVYGDVALDHIQGGTIVSTEQIFAFLAHKLPPVRMILVGSVDGVYEADPLRVPTARPISAISAANWDSVRAKLGGSHAVDVTGGMLSKVDEMVGLVREIEGLEVTLLSGERAGALETALCSPGRLVGGTSIRWQ